MPKSTPSEIRRYRREEAKQVAKAMHDWNQSVTKLKHARAREASAVANAEWEKIGARRLASDAPRAGVSEAEDETNSRNRLVGGWILAKVLAEYALAESDHFLAPQFLKNLRAIELDTPAADTQLASLASITSTWGRLESLHEETARKYGMAVGGDSESTEEAKEAAELCDISAQVRRLAVIHEAWAKSLE